MLADARTAILIVHYRTFETTLQCVQSLEAEVVERPHCQVLVVDNGSADGSDELLEEEFQSRGWEDWVQLIRTGRNGGFAAGVNAGVAALRAQHYLLLNSDAILRPGALGALLHALALHPRAAVVGPRVLLPNRGDHPSCFRWLTPLSEFLRAAKTGPLSRLLPRSEVLLPHGDEPQEPPWISFACVLVRGSALEEAGGLDEGFFMYFEDLDFCRRVRTNGWSVLFWPAAEVVHDRGSSGSGWDSTENLQRPPRYFYASRSRYFAKYYGQVGLWLTNLLWCAGRLVSWCRELAGQKVPHSRRREGRDNWTSGWHPLRPPAPPTTSGDSD